MSHEEVHDSQEVLLTKAKMLAELVRKSEYLVIRKEVLNCLILQKLVQEFPLPLEFQTLEAHKEFGH